MATFDATQLISELDAGMLNSKLSQILKETALSVLEQKKPGRVSLNFDLKKIGDNSQIALTHKLSYKRPTAKGETTGYVVDVVPVYCSGKGEISILPNNQTNIFHKEPA